MSCAYKIEEIALSHDNPEKVWTVTQALDAVEQKFQRRYTPSWMQEVLTLLSANGPFPGHRSIFHRINGDAYKLLPTLIAKRKKELEKSYGGKRIPIKDTRVYVSGVTDVPTPKPLGLHRKPPKLEHLYQVDVVTVDQAYYWELVDNAELLQRVRQIVRRVAQKGPLLRELRAFLKGTGKPLTKLVRRGRGADLDRIKKPHRNVRRHTEGLTWHMKQALLAPVFNVAGNTARGLAHRDLAVEKKGRYFKTTLGEHVTVYLKMQGEK